MDETLKDSISDKSSQDMDRRKAEIIALIMNKPRRWSELKEITGLSSSTLFRILAELENNNLVQREYIEKKIQWTITEKGKDRAAISDILGFLKKGKVFEAKGVMDFDHWIPREKPIEKTSQKKSEAGDSEDEEFKKLEAKYIFNLLFKDKKKKFLKRYEKEEFQMSTFIFPTIVVDTEPSNPEPMQKFAKKIVSQILEKKEELYSSLLPKDRRKLKNASEVTKKVLFVFDVELTATKKLLEDMLQSTKAL